MIDSVAQSRSIVGIGTGRHGVQFKVAVLPVLAHGTQFVEVTDTGGATDSHTIGDTVAARADGGDEVNR